MHFSSVPFRLTWGRAGQRFLVAQIDFLEDCIPDATGSMGAGSITYAAKMRGLGQKVNRHLKKNLRPPGDFAGFTLLNESGKAIRISAKLYSDRESSAKPE